MLEIKNVSPFCLVNTNYDAFTVEAVKALFADNSVDVEICENGYIAIVQPKTEIVSFKLSTSDILSFDSGSQSFNSGSSGVVSIPRSAFSSFVYHEHL